MDLTNILDGDTLLSITILGAWIYHLINKIKDYKQEHKEERDVLLEQIKEEKEENKLLVKSQIDFLRVIEERLKDGKASIQTIKLIHEIVERISKKLENGIE